MAITDARAREIRAAVQSGLHESIEAARWLIVDEAGRGIYAAKRRDGAVEYMRHYDGAEIIDTWKVKA